MKCSESDDSWNEIFSVKKIFRHIRNVHTFAQFDFNPETFLQNELREGSNEDEDDENSGPNSEDDDDNYEDNANSDRLPELESSVPTTSSGTTPNIQVIGDSLDGEDAK